MIKNNLNQLLEKYWSCDTTLDEEQILKHYFSSNEVVEEHLPYKHLFNHFTSSNEALFDKDIASLIAASENVAEDSNTIDTLLKKYWAGESNLVEEQELRSYFNGQSVAEEHKAYATFFTFLGKEQTLTASKLDVASIIKKNESISTQPRTAKIRSLNARVRSMAAVVAILFVAGFAFYTSGLLNTTKYANKHTVFNEEADREEALAVTKEALAFISTKFGKGQSVVQKELKQFNKLNILTN